MNISNCISCNSSEDVSVKYTGAYSKVSWKRYDAVSTLLSLLNEIVIWPIPLCENCFKIAYEKKLKSDIGKNFFIFLSGILAGAGFLGLSLSSMVEDRPILRIICFGLFILAALAVVVTPILMLINKLKLVRFSKTKTIPKNDESLAFIGMAEEILKSSDLKFKEYNRPKFLKLEEMPMDNSTRREISKWRESPGKFPEERELEVYQHACSLIEEFIIYLKNIGEINKLPFPDEWLKETTNGNGFGKGVNDGIYSRDFENLKDPNITYKAEDPDATWECPKCKEINLNTSFKCKLCGYSLM